jgi:hypothetical protein
MSQDRKPGIYLPLLLLLVALVLAAAIAVWRFMPLAG